MSADVPCSPTSLEEKRKLVSRHVNVKRGRKRDRERLAILITLLVSFSFNQFN